MYKTRIAPLVLVGLGIMTCAAVAAQQPLTAAQQAPSSAPDKPYGPATYKLGQGWDSRYGYQSETHQIAQQYIKATKPEEKQELRKKLSDALAKQFDTNVEQQQTELADLEKQIADLRALLKKRLDAKTPIVERRLEQLIQEAEGLGWSAPGAPSPRGMMGGSSSRPTTILAPTANPASGPEAAR